MSEPRHMWVSEADAPGRGLTDDERAFLTHMSRFGPDGYPVRKTKGGRWLWDDFRSVKSAPVVYKTKREAVAAIETFLDVLRDASDHESFARTVRELREHGHTDADIQQMCDDAWACEQGRAA